MTGISQYKAKEVEYVLKAIVRKVKPAQIMEEFCKRFGRPLNQNQIRYIKNKYGKDPRFGSALVNYKGQQAADLDKFVFLISPEQDKMNSNHINDNTIMSNPPKQIQGQTSQPSLQHQHQPHQTNAFKDATVAAAAAAVAARSQQGPGSEGLMAPLNHSFDPALYAFHYPPPPLMGDLANNNMFPVTNHMSLDPHIHYGQSAMPPDGRLPTLNSSVDLASMRLCSDRMDTLMADISASTSAAQGQTQTQNPNSSSTYGNRPQDYYYGTQALDQTTFLNSMNDAYPPYWQTQQLHQDVQNMAYYPPTNPSAAPNVNPNYYYAMSPQIPYLDFADWYLPTGWAFDHQSSSSSRPPPLPRTRPDPTKGYKSPPPPLVIRVPEGTPTKIPGVTKPSRRPVVHAAARPAFEHCNRNRNNKNNRNNGNGNIPNLAKNMENPTLSTDFDTMDFTLFSNNNNTNNTNQVSDDQTMTDLFPLTEQDAISLDEDLSLFNFSLDIPPANNSTTESMGDEVFEAELRHFDSRQQQQQASSTTTTTTPVVAAIAQKHEMQDNAPKTPSPKATSTTLPSNPPPIAPIKTKTKKQNANKKRLKRKYGDVNGNSNGKFAIGMSALDDPFIERPSRPAAAAAAATRPTARNPRDYAATATAISLRLR